ncbi:MAG: Glycosyl transferase family 2 [Candidatus Moranbacteria bacterium GW2011_GWE1_36_7]|nr:MAG: Glycosyl transferase family 2 [Candidatus Moranbacteria bacterium GW2011_GWD2_36_12]KKQ06386.1 MAG: Glycosyl transferase family 2 [Candidatus Moranbacteria bacterium GW2011_GWE2_36_40]KKQ14826.1 MAG: Glycosyl transferase family 2 [Candidatus Moranbacteria bacterium GW2011_GWE1_36_7]
MEISIIILNYKSEQYLSRCIESLQKSLTTVSYEILIINNDSSLITSIFPTENVRIIENRINEGFAKACNQAASTAKGNFLFFLNPDTEIITGNIMDLIVAMSDPFVGITAPHLITSSGKIQPWSTGYDITLWDIVKNNFGIIKSKRLWGQDSPVEVSWASGAAFIIKKSLFNELLGFDEKFFMYFEDVDLCKRVLEKKLKIISLPSVQVLHIGGQSSSNSNQQKKYYYQSQDYYFKKHFGTFSLFFLKLLRMPTLWFNKN